MSNNLHGRLLDWLIVRNLVPDPLNVLIWHMRVLIHTAAEFVLRAP